MSEPNQKRQIVARCACSFASLLSVLGAFYICLTHRDFVVCAHAKCGRVITLKHNSKKELAKTIEKCKDHYRCNSSHKNAGYVSKDFRRAITAVFADADYPAVEHDDDIDEELPSPPPMLQAPPQPQPQEQPAVDEEKEEAILDDLALIEAAAKGVQGDPQPINPGQQRLLDEADEGIKMYLNFEFSRKRNKGKYIPSRMYNKSAPKDIKANMAQESTIPVAWRSQYDKTLNAIMQRQGRDQKRRMMTIHRYVYTAVLVQQEKYEAGSFNQASPFEAEYLDSFLKLLRSTVPAPVKPGAQMEYIRSWLAYLALIQSGVSRHEHPDLAHSLQLCHGPFTTACATRSRALSSLNSRLDHFIRQWTALDQPAWSLSVAGQHDLLVRAYQTVYTVYQHLFMAGKSITAWQWRLVQATIVVAGMITGSCNRSDFWVQCRWSDVQHSIVNQQDHISLMGVSKTKGSRLQDTHYITGVWWAMMRMYRPIHLYFFPGEPRCFIHTQQGSSHQYGPFITALVKFGTTVLTCVQFDPSSVRIAATTTASSRAGSVAVQDKVQLSFGHSVAVGHRWYNFQSAEHQAWLASQNHDEYLNAVFVKDEDGLMRRITSQYGQSQKKSALELLADSPLFVDFDGKFPSIAAIEVDADKKFASCFHVNHKRVAGGGERYGQELLYLYRGQRLMNKVNYTQYSGFWMSVGHHQHLLVRKPAGQHGRFPIDWDEEDVEEEEEEEEEEKKEEEVNKSRSGKEKKQKKEVVRSSSSSSSSISSSSSSSSSGSSSSSSSGSGIGIRRSSRVITPRKRNAGSSSESESGSGSGSESGSDSASEEAYESASDYSASESDEEEEEEEDGAWTGH
jgi:hypothetical protein